RRPGTSLLPFRARVAIVVGGGPMSLSSVRAALGTPWYESDGFLLYNVDCLDALASLPADSIDLTVTSPPYNIGKEYEKPLPLDDYLAWSARWLRGLHRATVPRGALWLNLGYCEMPGRARAVPLPYLLWERSPFYLLQEIVWQYAAGVHTR